MSSRIVEEKLDPFEGNYPSKRKLDINAIADYVNIASDKEIEEVVKYRNRTGDVIWSKPYINAVSVENTLGKDVYIEDRMGVRIKANSTFDPKDPTRLLRIIQTVEAANHCCEFIPNKMEYITLHSKSDGSNIEIDYIPITPIVRPSQINNGNNKVFRVEYHLTKETLYKCTRNDEYKSVYFPQFDLTISFNNGSWGHPYTQHRSYAEYAANRAGNTLTMSGFGLNVSIVVGHPDKIFTRYFNLNGNAYPVRAIYDRGVVPGIYISTGCGSESGKAEIQHFDLDELKLDHPWLVTSTKGRTDLSTLPFPFFTSAEDARTMGNYDSALKKAEREKEEQQKQRELEIKMELQEQKLEIERLKNKNEADKIEYDRERALAKIEEERRKEEYEKRKRKLDEEEERLKHQYKMAEHNRKDTTEFLKWIPVVLTACLTIATLVVKFVSPVKT